MKVCVVGGGQLVHMMCVFASELNIDINVLVEGKGVSGDKVFKDTKIGSASSFDDIYEVAKECDVLTFEHEHVPQEVIKKLEASNILTFPSSDALKYAQNKLFMRKRLSELGVKCPDWNEVKTISQIDEFLKDHQGVAILKRPTGGYDGKGVMSLKSVDLKNDNILNTINEWFEIHKTLLLEEKVNFTREVAALVVRSSAEEEKAWDIVESRQKNNICKTVIAPCPNILKNDMKSLKQLAKNISRQLDVVGVMAVELFEIKTAQGYEYLVNELAMRPHNSGHWTINGSVTSQFENHLRAVLGLPLGNTKLISKKCWTVMENILGSNHQNLDEILPNAMKISALAKINLYNKEVKPGRKLGHVNVMHKKLDKALNISKDVVKVLEN